MSIFWRLHISDFFAQIGNCNVSKCSMCMDCIVATRVYGMPKYQSAPYLHIEQVIRIKVWSFPYFKSSCYQNIQPTSL